MAIMASVGRMNEIPNESAGFFVVLNGSSGHHATAETATTIAGILGRAGRRFEIAEVERPGELETHAARMAAKAHDARGVLVAAGGDGTLRTVAQLAVDRQLPFGVLPAGTFNYFGRSYGIPTEIDEATRALVTAREKPVQVGLVSDRVFLVNASVGLYPELLEDREAFKRRFGRNRFVAVCSGLATLLRDHQPLLLQFDHEGERRMLRTSTLFVGNSRLQLKQVGIEEAGVVRQDRLAGVVVRPMGRWGLAGIALRGALGSLGEAEGVDSFAFARLDVSGRASRQGSFKVATDGEIAVLSSPLTFAVAPRSLRLLVPDAK